MNICLEASTDLDNQEYDAYNNSIFSFLFEFIQLIIITTPSRLSINCLQIGRNLLCVEFPLHLHPLTRMLIQSSLRIRWHQSRNLRLLILCTLVLLDYYWLPLEATNSQEQKKADEGNCKDYKEDDPRQHILIYSQDCSNIRKRFIGIHVDWQVILFRLSNAVYTRIYLHCFVSQIKDDISINHPIRTQQESIQRLNTKANLTSMSVPQEEVAIWHPANYFTINFNVNTRKHVQQGFLQSFSIRHIYLHTLQPILLCDLALTLLERTAVLNFLKHQVVLLGPEVCEGGA